MPPQLTSRLTREDQLCLLLARGQLTPDLQQRTREFLASPLRWPLILERAYTHQVYPLVYRNLRQLGFPAVPEAVQTELKASYMANALHNQLLAEELARLLRLLSDAGIPVIPLKGVTLAESLFGDPAARVCADLDLLVPPGNVTQALDKILASGYRDDARDPFFSKLTLHHGRHYDLVRDDRGASFLLELHWQVVQHSSRNDEAIKDLWAEARPKVFFGAPTVSLSPEWEFLYLSIHAADHGWQSLKWLADIHQVASCALVDWLRIMEKAERLGLDLVIRRTVTACALLLGTPLPSGYSTASLPAGVPRFPKPPFPAGAPEAAFFHLRALKHPLDKLRCIVSVVLVPKQADRDFLQLPAPLGFFSYVVRPLRLVGKWLLRLPAHIFQDGPVNVGKEREGAREAQAVKDGQRSDSA